MNPFHVVLIPDGNRRWARANGLPEPLGHSEGTNAMERIFDAAQQTNITHLTFWCASVANLTKRSSGEVSVLAALFKHYLKKLAKHSKIHEHKIRVRVLGRWAEFLPAGVVDAARKAMDATAGYTERNLTLLLAYTGTDEMLAAVNRIADQARKNPNLAVEEKLIKSNLWTAELPPVDLVIRTGGESHWSAGLLMWDVADAQLSFTKTLWPAFGPDEFLKTLENFKQINRRFGR